MDYRTVDTALMLGHIFLGFVLDVKFNILWMV